MIIEYEVHGNIVRTGASYDNRFISVATIEDRKIVRTCIAARLDGEPECST